jgi:hypothetical protein
MTYSSMTFTAAVVEVTRTGRVMAIIPSIGVGIGIGGAIAIVSFNVTYTHDT